MVPIVRFRPVAKRNAKLSILLFVLCTYPPGRAQNPAPSPAPNQEEEVRLAEAENSWRLAVQQNPQDASAHANLGLVLSKEGKYPEAIAAYKSAFQLNPKLPGIQLNWGIAEFKQGRFQQAIPPLTGALAADPGSSQARTLLGLSCYGAKQFAEASKYLATIV